MKRSALRARHFSQFLGLTEDLHRLVRDLLSKGGKPDDPPGSLDKGDAKQCLQLPQTRRQCGLGDEAGVSGLPEMTKAAESDQILELLYGGEMDDHLIEKSNHRQLYNGLERFKPDT